MWPKLSLRHFTALSLFFNEDAARLRETIFLRIEGEYLY